MSVDRIELTLACCLAAVASLLVFPNLGKQALWQDEGQTAVVAQNVLRTGLPSASDGKNLVSIFADHRDVRSGLSIWQPFAPVYLAAASMAIGGQNAAAARFPFAVAFVLLIVSGYRVVLRWSGDRQAALATAILMAGSVVLLLHARQCRYYLLAPLLNLWIVHSYLLLKAKPRWSVTIGLILSSTLLINVFFPGAIVLALGLMIDGLLRSPGRQTWRHLILAAVVVAVVNLPVAVFLKIWSRPFGVQPGYSGVPVFSLYLLRYLLTLNLYFFPVLLLIPASIVAVRQCRARELEDNGLLVISFIVCLTQLIGFSLISDYPFTRYLIGAAPFLFYLGAASIQRLAARRAVLLWPLVVLSMVTNWGGVLSAMPARGLFKDAHWSKAGIDGQFLEPGRIGISYARGEIATIVREGFGSPLSSYLRSVLRPPRGPVDVILETLRQEAKPSDVVKISYEDLPLMFHTDLNVVSATAIGPAAPDWIIERYLSRMRADPDFLKETMKFQYEEKTLPIPDVQWNNQPDPIYHFFEELPSGIAPSLKVFKKLNR
jgi:4-amino-4-deoxy-L-arabinose transferase-like glycosyltransferase